MNGNKYETNGPLDQWLFMPLAARVGRWLHYGGFTPNGVTTLSLLAGAGGVVCLALDRWWAASALLASYYLFDCADGIIARTFGLVSDFGEVYDFLKDVALFLVGSLVLISKLGALPAVAAGIIGVYLMVWEGVMDCRACHRRHAHYDFYAVKVGRGLWRPYLGLMLICYRLGRPFVNWPLHWFGSGEFVALLLLLLGVGAAYYEVGSAK